jgi:hypothetical protein
MDRHVATVSTFLALLLLSCGGLRIDSRWLDRDIIIDGDDSDWQDLKLYVKDWPVDIGVANDDDFLYVTLSTADRNLQRQAIMRGFEVWIDPDGRRGRILGVRYPLGMLNVDREGMDPMRDQAAFGDFQGRRYQDEQEQLRRAGPAQLQDAFERILATQQPMLLGRGEKEIRSLTMLGEKDVRVMVTLADGRLVYEARFPLEGQYPLPRLPSKPGKNIAIGFKTREIDFRAFQNHDNPRQTAGGFGGQGGGFGGRDGGFEQDRGGGYGGGRGRGAGFSGNRLQPIEEWTKITLARSPSDPAPE